MFYGLGSDGTVAPTRTRSRSSAKRPTTTRRATSCTTPRRPGSVTVSHLRFGKNADQQPYLIDRANFVACHNPTLPREVRHALQDRRGRHLPAHDASTARIRLGHDAAGSPEADHRQEGQVLRDRRDHPGAGDRPRPAHQRRSCRPRSSRSAASCPRTRPSPPSRRPSRRPTADTARRSSR